MENSGGYANATGHYTGMIGIMQRDEADFGPQFIRSDGMMGEPVELAPVFGPADVAIISGLLPSRSKIVQVTDVVGNFDLTMYCYLCVLLYFLVTCLIGSFVCNVVKWRNGTKFNRGQIVKRISRIFFELFRILVDQESFESSVWSHRLIWLSGTMTIFVVLLGYLLNLISTDLMVTIKPSQVDSLTDQISEDFKEVKPYILKNYYLYGILQKTRKGSRLERLHELFKRYPDHQIEPRLDGNADEYLKMNAKLYPSFMTHFNASLLLPDYYWNTMFLPAGCQYDPKIIKKLYCSKDTFANGNLHYFMNKKAGQGFKKFLTFRLRAVFEFQVIEHAFDRFKSVAMNDLMSKPVTFGSLNCKSKENYMNLETEPILFHLAALGNLLLIIGICLLFSLILLIVELNLHILAKCRCKYRIGQKPAKVIKPKPKEFLRNPKKHRRIGNFRFWQMPFWRVKIS